MRYLGNAQVEVLARALKLGAGWLQGQERLLAPPRPQAMEAASLVEAKEEKPPSPPVGVPVPEPLLYTVGFCILLYITYICIYIYILLYILYTSRILSEIVYLFN
jgi:hypothetical protein